jgi:hypothetical protein
VVFCGREGIGCPLLFILKGLVLSSLKFVKEATVVNVFGNGLGDGDGFIELKGLEDKENP